MCVSRPPSSRSESLEELLGLVFFQVWYKSDKRIFQSLVLQIPPIYSFLPVARTGQLEFPYVYSVVDCHVINLIELMVESWTAVKVIQESENEKGNVIPPWRNLLPPPFTSQFCQFVCMLHGDSKILLLKVVRVQLLSVILVQF